MLLAGLAVLAGALRLIHIRALSKAPVFSVLLGDSKRYVEWASEIAGGNWLGSGAFYQAPLYPYVLATIFSVFGESIEIIRIAQALAGGLACVLVAVAGRWFFNWQTGLAAGVALAAYPPAIFFDGHIQKSSLDVLLMAAAIVAVAKYQSDAKSRSLILLGLSLGCLTINRENARVFYPLLVAWLLVRNRDAALKHRLQTIAVFSLAALVPIAPVAIRNYHVAGELLVSTSQLGSNFYIGNHQGASGVYEPLVPDRASVIYEQEDAVRLATTAVGRPLSASEVSNYWFVRTVDEIRRDPGGWTRLMFRKLLLSVNAVETMDTESIEFHTSYSPVLRALAPITFGVVLPLAVAGIVLTVADFRRLAVLYGIGLVFIGSVVLFFVLARYRYPVVPVVMLLAGAAIAGAGDAWRRRPRRLMVATSCAIAIAIVVNRPIRATSEESYANFGAELLRLERPYEAIPLLVKAVELLPNAATVHRDLALAHLKGGDPASAAREYATSARLEPDDPANHRELAVAAEAAGDRTTALNGLREAARLEPSNVSTQTKLGDLLVRLGKPVEARVVYERALLSAGANPQETVGLQVRIASLDVNDGRFPEALRRLEGAAAMARSSGQTALASDAEATIQALRRRLSAQQ
ncbi:MAG: glycosyltransferase family 39 protein [Vicinamibacterales bacterium]